MNTFGKRLVAAREKQGLSQKELAERLCITPTRLNYWEKDKREPDVNMIRQIADVLETDPNYLLGICSDALREQSGNKKSEPGFSKNELELIELYRRADEADRLAVNLILQKYADPEVTIPASAG